jgi:hypothetical protein
MLNLAMTPVCLQKLANASRDACDLSHTHRRRSERSSELADGLAATEDIGSLEEDRRVQTGKLEGPGLMLVGIVLLLTALFVYNAPYSK